MDVLNRREFVRAMASVAAIPALAGRAAAATDTRPIDLPADVRITAITASRHYTRHPRKIGHNSFKDHGPGHHEGLVRVQTDAGVEGVGNTLDERAVGKKLGDFLEVRDGYLRLRHDVRSIIKTSSEGVLLDIVGKLLKRPAAALLGPIVRSEVPCYDGSIYMRDLEHAEGVIRSDTQNGMAAGHHAFKIKIGRGNWLKDRVAGYERDVRAIRTVHETVGDDGHILIDANNYYNLEDSMRILDDTAAIGLYWAEEMFREEAQNHDDYRKLRAFVEQRKLKTLLADGESGRGDGDLLPLLESGVVQVAQPDIRTLGVFAFVDYARRIAPFGALIGPHTWAKQLGVPETAVVGMVAPNFTMVEDCRLTSDVVKLPHMKITSGKITLGDAPGLGVVIDEAAYEKHCAPEAKTVKAT